ncbi:MAG: dinitrogenase iron-molybdenum cofactor biosynthesis protein [Chlorobi bacterium]|nr:dinitrogenase iron-molybdenum cofactor biosynthesis protein [Chlorobiota bacterium]
MKRIAVVTNDGNSVSQHFGRSRYYKIIIVENGEITGSEMRDRTIGHFDPQNQSAQRNNNGNGRDPHYDGQGRHGYGAEATSKHAMMARQIADCDTLIAGGMGMGAYESFKSAGLNVILTDHLSIDDAAKLYAEGKLVNLYHERTD